jgi:hypothetical protein
VLDPLPLHAVSREHLEALTDDVGIMQHAIESRPDPAHGYCTDDVARALQVDLLHHRELGWDVVAGSARRNLRFLDEAFDRTSGRFRNFRRADRTWIDETASEDSQGRAILALGEVIAQAPDLEMIGSATSLLEQALPGARRLQALRARASVFLGCHAALVAGLEGQAAASHRLLADGFQGAFESGAASSWPWPEPSLTYENALPVRALLVAGQDLQSQRMVDLGLGLLDWLIAVQTEPSGHLSPVGNEWWPRDGVRARFDQQPIEATALLLAAEVAHTATGAQRYLDVVERSYAWFLGGNDLGLDVADPARGASHDGLTPRGVNANQGAESTLMWLTALEHVRAIREVDPASSSPAVAVVSSAA